MQMLLWESRASQSLEELGPKHLSQGPNGDITLQTLALITVTASQPAEPHTTTLLLNDALFPWTSSVPKTTSWVWRHTIWYIYNSLCKKMLASASDLPLGLVTPLHCRLMSEWRQAWNSHVTLSSDYACSHFCIPRCSLAPPGGIRWYCTFAGRLHTWGISKHEECTPGVACTPLTYNLRMWQGGRAQVPETKPWNTNLICCS